MKNDAKPLWPVATLVALTGLNLLDYLDRQLLAAVLPALQADLHIGDQKAGTIATAFMLGYFLTAPIFGWLGDRVSRRWLIAGGVFVWSLGTLLSGHANAFIPLLCFRVLVGFGEASFGTIRPGWIADLFPPQRRNNAITIFYFAIPVGSALGYLMGGYLAVHCITGGGRRSCGRVIPVCCWRSRSSCFASRPGARAKPPPRWRRWGRRHRRDGAATCCC